MEPQDMLSGLVHVIIVYQRLNDTTTSVTSVWNIKFCECFVLRKSLSGLSFSTTNKPFLRETQVA